MAMFMDPTYDFVFKDVFGSMNRLDVTKSFVNALCHFTGDDTIEIVSFLNKEQLPGNTELQLGRTFVDIYCEDRKGHKFIIEVQRGDDHHFTNRLMLYFSRMFASQYAPPEFSYDKLYPIIVIAIANNIPEMEGMETYRSSHVFHEEAACKRYLNQAKFILVELDELTKQESELETDEDTWLFFLKRIASATHVPEALQTGEFKKACDLLNLMTKNAMARMEYENLVAGVDAMESSRRIEEEMAEAKGEARGKAEAKIELAKNLLADGMPVEKVAALTGLSVDTLRRSLDEDERN